MAWFIIQCERKTWTRYLVEADDEDDALMSDGDWQYLGYMDGDDTDSTVVGGPFPSDAAALDDIVSYVDG